MKKILPKEGDLRAIHFFALWPIMIETDWRWLEWVTIEQVYYFPKYIPNRGPYWESVRFIPSP